MASVILSTKFEVFAPVSGVSRITVKDPRGGSGGGGVRTLPSRTDACLRLKFSHRQDRISLFNRLMYLMKRALHFATRQNSWDIKKCDCFWVLSSDLFTSARKAVVPAPTATGAHRGGCSKGVSFTGASVHGKGPKNYNVQPWPVGGEGGVLSEPKFGPPLPPLPPSIKNFWMRPWKRWLILENTAL